MRKIESLTEMSNQQLWVLFPIILAPYCPEWPELFRREAALLKRAVGEQRILRISHIGSTAVPGLLAKPAIDILLEISGETTLGEFQMSLEEAGYLFAAQPGKPAPGMMFLKGDTPQGFAREVFHVHVRYLGDWDELYFRDYLRQFPRKAAEYEALKRRLQVKYTHDRDAYTQAKGSFIKSTTALARKHFGAKYKPGAAQGQATRIE